MKIACVCCTYLRARQLAEAIACFEQQDYPLNSRELVVLDDAGQYRSQRGRGWRIISVGQRFRTLGEKRNAAIGLASHDVEAYAVWDDDDLYLPWHLSSLAPALERSEWVAPEQVLHQGAEGVSRVETAGYFHAAWLFRRQLLERLQGYGFLQKGEDQDLRRRFESLGAQAAVVRQPAPSFVHRWFTRAGYWHLSALGTNGYEWLGQRRPARRAERVVPALAEEWSRMIHRARNQA